MMHILLALLASVPASQDTTPAYGWVEFSREPAGRLRSWHSIKVFVVLDETSRLRYIGDVGTNNARALTVRAPSGKTDFVVIVEPADRASLGEPTNPVRRTRSNVTVDVEPGKSTPVQIGGFVDFQRPAHADGFGTNFVRGVDDPEASQFRTQIIVGEPRRVKEDELR